MLEGFQKIMWFLPEGFQYVRRYLLLEGLNQNKSEFKMPTILRLGGGRYMDEILVRYRPHLVHIYG